MSYAFPREVPVPRGSFDLCDGPFAYGSTQVQQYEDRWAAWVATNGIRFGKWRPGQVMNDEFGSVNPLFTGGERPAKVSLCFDQDALPCFAILSDTNEITLRKYVSGTPTEFVFTGSSPLLFYNGTVIQDTGITDVVCLYIKPDGDKLFARCQRDLFATEYEINVALPATVVELSKTDWRMIGGITYQFIYGRDDEGRQLVLRTDAYPPYAPAFTARAVVTVGFGSGVYFPTILTVTQTTEKSSLSVALQSGVYFPTVLYATQPTEKASLAVGLQSGSYPLVIQIADQSNERANLTVGLLSGNYALVVQDGGSYTEKANLTVGLLSGSYT